MSVLKCAMCNYQIDTDEEEVGAELGNGEVVCEECVYEMEDEDGDD